MTNWPRSGISLSANSVFAKAELPRSSSVHSARRPRTTRGLRVETAGTAVVTKIVRVMMLAPTWHVVAGGGLSYLPNGYLKVS